MSTFAIWLPHSTEQIFEAGIKTCCSAYLNEAGSSIQHFQTQAIDGNQGGERALTIKLMAT